MRKKIKLLVTIASDWMSDFLFRKAFFSRFCHSPSFLCVKAMVALALLVKLARQTFIFQFLQLGFVSRISNYLNLRNKCPFDELYSNWFRFLQFIWITFFFWSFQACLLKSCEFELKKNSNFLPGLGICFFKSRCQITKIRKAFKDCC